MKANPNKHDGDIGFAANSVRSPDTIVDPQSTSRPRDIGIKSNLAWKATGTVMNFLEKSLGINLSTEGLDNLTQQPTLYVVNHFTRAETFIIPYLLYKLRKENARSLAHHGLFAGILGRYLSRLGAVSTKEEMRNRMIIGDLMTGRKNWVIYPEGIMVKNKKFMDRGNFIIEAPEYNGPPRTGAAVLAIRAETYRRKYLVALEKEDFATMKQLEEEYFISDSDSISRKPLVITPINITYYPIRPEENKVSRLARSIVTELPERIEEELKVEGRILLGKTDMRIYFCPAISLEGHLEPCGFVPRLLAHLQGEKSQMDQTLRTQRLSLTSSFMGAIYKNLEVNFDHLFCYGLYALKEKRVRKTTFHKALLLTALELERLKLCRLHVSVSEACTRIALGLEYEPLTSVVKECMREGILEDAGDSYIVDRNRFDGTVSFHDIRLRLTSKVIANEFEPLLSCVSRLARNVNRNEQRASRSLAHEFFIREKRVYEDDYARYFDAALSKSPSVGEPFDLWPDGHDPRAGVLLIHGYLAAPMEMRFIGESLRGQGFRCHGLRLPGHGTSPINLVDTKWSDWLQAIRSAYAMLKCQHERVYVVGFSMGGLLALLNASELGRSADGMVTINAALKLKDNRAGLAGAAVLWNGFLQNMKIDSGRLEYVNNVPTNPGINYTRNYIKGVRQLGLAIQACQKKLPMVECPILVVQSTGDPVVDPESASLIYGKIRSSEKSLCTIEANSHVIVTDEFREEVAMQTSSFINALEMEAAPVPHSNRIAI